MANAEIRLTECGDGDWDILIAFTKAFCAEDRHPHGPRNEAALRALVANPIHGRAAIIRSGDVPVGYAVLCYGFSLEFCGRDGFIDEFYVAPEHRGRGIASAALARLADLARGDGIEALHLEVMDGNDRAARLYRRHGWEQRASRLMTRLLPAADAP
jgi:GNAT superfamily N-acetyltransferase